MASEKARPCVVVCGEYQALGVLEATYEETVTLFQSFIPAIADLPASQIKLSTSLSTINNGATKLALWPRAWNAALMMWDRDEEAVSSGSAGGDWKGRGWNTVYVEVKEAGSAPTPQGSKLVTESTIVASLASVSTPTPKAESIKEKAESIKEISKEATPTPSPSASMIKEEPVLTPSHSGSSTTGEGSTSVSEDSVMLQTVEAAAVAAPMTAMVVASRQSSIEFAKSPSPRPPQVSITIGQRVESPTEIVHPRTPSPGPQPMAMVPIAPPTPSVALKSPTSTSSIPRRQTSLGMDAPTSAARPIPGQPRPQPQPQQGAFPRQASTRRPEEVTVSQRRESLISILKTTLEGIKPPLPEISTSSPPEDQQMPPGSRRSTGSYSSSPPSPAIFPMTPVDTPTGSPGIATGGSYLQSAGQNSLAFPSQQKNKIEFPASANMAIRTAPTTPHRSPAHSRVHSRVHSRASSFSRPNMARSLTDAGDLELAMNSLLAPATDLLVEGYAGARGASRPHIKSLRDSAGGPRYGYGSGSFTGVAPEVKVLIRPVDEWRPATTLTLGRWLPVSWVLAEYAKTTGRTAASYQFMWDGQKLNSEDPRTPHDLGIREAFTVDAFVSRKLE